MTERRWRCSRKLCRAATFVLLLAGLTAANQSKNDDTDSSANPTEAAEKSSSVSPSGDTERDRRQVYPRVQSHRPYGELPTHTPTEFLATYSVFAARPNFVSTQVSNSHHLARPLLTPIITSFVIEGKQSVARKPTLTKVFPSLKSEQTYTPSRTPAVSQPFLGPGSGIGPQVSPVPQHLRPLQPQPPTHAYGAPPPYPGPRQCPAGLQCLPLVSCAPFYHQVENQPQLSCSIFGGAVGVCCPGQPNRSSFRQLDSESEMSLPTLDFTTEVINEAGRAGLQELAAKDLLDRALQEHDAGVKETQGPSYAHLQPFKTSSLAFTLSRYVFVKLMAGYHLLRKIWNGLQQFALSSTIIADTSPMNPVCTERESFYRTIDGSCNNLEHPSWGQARTGFQRLLPPYYSDGVFRPRESVGGSSLPSARVVSTSIVGDQDRPDPDLTLSVMQWGQFIDHDLAHTPIHDLGNMSGIQCCSNDGRDVVNSTFLHPACLPIEVPANDPFFGGSGRRCMNFVRSIFAPRTNPCNLGYAEQMNLVTHYLDGSNIYGSSGQQAQQLRQFRGGLLSVQGRDLLPPDPEVTECQSTRDGIPCFMAGDGRVNQQIELAVIHTVWVRFHNRVARELARLNPQWSDETIYQETRRIVVAMYQHIIYNEWLPLILGKDYMAENGLLPLREGYSRDYDSGLNAAVLNEFATVAFRFGHSLVQGMIQLVDKTGVVQGSLPLYDNFHNPRQIYSPGRLDEFLRGLATQPIQQLDNYVTSSLTNRLFQTPQMPVGLDLVALNTQRGRDHGVAPYNHLRSACGLPRARTFKDLLEVIPQKVVQVFQQLYASVDDIDPFVAGISERPAPGSLLGPTFRYIIGDQFTRLKRGDRFFYDLADMRSSLSKAQLNSIRMVSWARVLCETGDMLGYVQPLAFRLPRGLNERVPCDSPGIPGLDLAPWISS